jgi:hypothetical protein
MSQSSINAHSYPPEIPESAKIGWGFIILLTFAGFLSGVYTLVFIFFLISVWLKGNLWFLLLGSASFGLSLAAAFWFSGKIRSWWRFSVLTCVIITAHLVGLVPIDHLPQRVVQHFDHGPLRALPVFVVTLMLFVAAPLVIFPKRSVLRVVLVGLMCSTVGTLTLVSGIVTTAHDPRVFLFLPLGILWQTTLAGLLGIALRAQQFGVRSRIPEIHRIPSQGYSFAGVGVLLAYFVLVGLLHRSAEISESKRRQDVEDRMAAEIAQSLAETPSSLNLPELSHAPLDQVLLLNEIAGWTPYQSGSDLKPARLGGPNLAPCPPSINYRASYWNQTSAYNVQVTVTEYPNFEWAKYQVRNTPMPNELIEHRDIDLNVIKFGSIIYQEAPYSFWSSGNRLISLSFWGDSSAVEEEFLKAYLEKYPSSL